MLVLNKEAALDHVITRSLRLSEVVPEPYALRAPMLLTAGAAPGDVPETPQWRPALLDATARFRFTHAADGMQTVTAPGLSRPRQ